MSDWYKCQVLMIQILLFMRGYFYRAQVPDIASSDPTIMSPEQS